MTLDRNQVEQALERATRLDDDGTGRFELVDVQKVADELGLSREAVRQAVAEVSGQASGMLTVGASGYVPGDADAVHDALRTYLTLRGLAPAGAGVWRQQNGWWPDLYRFLAGTPVAVTVAPAGPRTFVGLTAGLDRVFRVHVAAAFFGLVAAALIFLSRPGVTQLATIAALTLGWLAADLWAFMRRRIAVEQRLLGALTDISQPRYRLTPW